MTEIEEFSSGYYSIEMVVCPYEGGPVIESQLHNHLSDEYYSQTDAPVMFRLGLDGHPYFEPSDELSIPVDHIGIPPSWFAENGMDETYGTQRVFVLKPDHSYLLQQPDVLDNRFNADDVMEE